MKKINLFSLFFLITGTLEGITSTPNAGETPPATIITRRYLTSPAHYGACGIKIAGVLYALQAIKEILTLKDTEKTETPGNTQELSNRLKKIEKEQQAWSGFCIYLLGCLAETIIMSYRNIQELQTCLATT